ncbi:hypothetical protein M8J75_005559 [Diaphorina citri]|nr:hypothetical protein M8J75_005559 [Diaphorina citri]
MLSDNEQPHQELVKCVVVGDTAVGKTRLICARACNKQVSLSQLLTTHVPTVWAIDQYRIYKDVLERSWDVVDGVNVSLRLWDTFGDHEKDRRFAYGRSDVVLLCFSLTSEVSLRNCRTMWFAEIRKFCPNTPVILVGCKNDLRFMYRDDTYLAFFRDHSPFVRATRKSDLIMPDEARSVAKELGVPYYETSVLTYHGVNEVFENAIRIALISRRQQRFWMTNLKKVQRPLLQEPYCPPKPHPLDISVAVSSYQDNMSLLLTQQAFTDVIFIVGASPSVGFSAHRFILSAASASLQALLGEDGEGGSAAGEMCRSASESSMVSTFGEATSGEFNEDTEHLIRSGTPSSTDRTSSHHGSHRPTDLKRRSSCVILSWTNGYHSDRASGYHSNGVEGKCVPSYHGERKRNLHAREWVVNHPAVTSIRMQQCEGLDNRGHKSTSLQTVITLNKLITPRAWQHVLHFLYTGSLDGLHSTLDSRSGGGPSLDSRHCHPSNMSLLCEIRQTCEFLNLPELLAIVTNIISHQEYLNVELVQRYKMEYLNVELVQRYKMEYLNVELVQRYKMNFRHRLQELGLSQGLFSDVMFQLEDGMFPSHRALLMARCEMFQAMFSGDFREGSAKVIVFPGIRADTFHILLSFIYTDELSPGIFLNPNKCIDILELSNRLCLQRLTNLIEKRLEDQLLCYEGSELIPLCLKLLEPTKFHNAHQVSAWCMNYLWTNYNKLCKCIAFIENTSSGPKDQILIFPNIINSFFYYFHNAHQVSAWCMNYLCINYNKLCKCKTSAKLLKSLHVENQEYLAEHRWPPVWNTTISTSVWQSGRGRTSSYSNRPPPVAAQVGASASKSRRPPPITSLMRWRHTPSYAW